MPNKNKVVLFHGFDQDRVIKLMRLIKGALRAELDETTEEGRQQFEQLKNTLAFCTSTEKNMEWKLKDIIEDVHKDHAAMMKFQADKQSKQ